MIKKYLSHYYWNYLGSSAGEKTKEGEKSYIESEYPIFREEVRKCLISNNYFWAIWSLRMLKEERMGDATVFNFDFAQCRVDMYKHVKDLYFK